jgi:hypothetical protein
MADMNYIHVKALDIVSALNASERSHTASRQMDRADSTVWAQTVVAVSPIVLREANKGVDTEVLAEEVRQALISSITAVEVIPETGKDRKGKTIQLAKKDGSIKWASWERTRRIMAYASDIAKITASGLGSELLQEDKNGEFDVAARCDILKQATSEKPLLKKVESVAGTLQKLLDLCTEDTDILGAFSHVQTLAVNNLDALVEAQALVARLDALIGSMESTDKDTLKPVLLKMAVKHYN